MPTPRTARRETPSVSCSPTFLWEYINLDTAFDILSTINCTYTPIYIGIPHTGHPLLRLPTAAETMALSPVNTLEKTPSRSVGPDYRPDGEKPTATVSTEVPHSNITVLKQTSQLIALLTYVDCSSCITRPAKFEPPI